MEKIKLCKIPGYSSFLKHDGKWIEKADILISMEIESQRDIEELIRELSVLKQSFRSKKSENPLVFRGPQTNKSKAQLAVEPDVTTAEQLYYIPHDKLPNVYDGKEFSRLAFDEVDFYRSAFIDGDLPLDKRHQCYSLGHNMHLVVEVDDGQTKMGYHRCSRCGYEKSFQFDYKKNTGVSDSSDSFLSPVVQERQMQESMLKRIFPDYPNGFFKWQYMNALLAKVISEKTA